MGTAYYSDALVLRKRRYSESSLILAVLTPEAGLQHFLLRNALRAGKQRFPEADLFRRLEITYRPARRSDLHSATKVECVFNYDRIARDILALRTAGWLVKFVLQNAAPALPAPRLYAVLCAAMARLDAADAKTVKAIADALRCSLLAVYLEENGLLPAENDGKNTRLYPYQWVLQSSGNPPSRDQLRAWGRALFQLAAAHHNRIQLPPRTWKGYHDSGK